MHRRFLAWFLHTSLCILGGEPAGGELERIRPASPPVGAFGELVRLSSMRCGACRCGVGGGRWGERGRWGNAGRRQAHGGVPLPPLTSPLAPPPHTSSLTSPPPLRHCWQERAGGAGRRGGQEGRRSKVGGKPRGKRACASRCAARSHPRSHPPSRPPTPKCDAAGGSGEGGLGRGRRERGGGDVEVGGRASTRAAGG